MSSIELFQEMRDIDKLLDLALKEAVARGRAMTAAEAKYYTVKDLRVRELMDEGFTATAINLIIKGEPAVNEAMHKYHDYEVEYKNACEAINVYKLRMRILESKIERDWVQAGRE